MRYKNVKRIATGIVGLIGIGVGLNEGISAALPGELRNLSSWFLLAILGVQFGLVFFIVSRGAFWIAEIWLQSSDDRLVAPGLRRGTIRLSRIAAFVVPIVWFFYAVSIGRFPPEDESKLVGALMAYPIIGGGCWFLVQVIGWIARGFVGDHKDENA